MSNIKYLLFFCIISAAGFGCEQRSPFGPTYDIEGNLARDTNVINTFLNNAEIDSLFRIHDPSGVVVIVQEEGDGAKPTGGRMVYANYIGKLLDGTVFDTNLEEVAKEHDIWDENRTYRVFQFAVETGQAIQGFDLGFKQLKSGSKAVLIIPSVWAYRDQDRDQIPANSVLMFEVELLGWE